MVDHVHETLKLYCEWLNLWMRADTAEGEEPTHLYHPTDFTVYEPSRNRYGSVSPETIIPLDGLRTLRIMEVNDGDEGGPSHLLTIWDETTIIQMTQMFDTMPQEIYNREHGGFARIP